MRKQIILPLFLFGAISLSGCQSTINTGIKGPTGEKGDTGLLGPEGPSGDKGDKGETGDKGDSGKDGLTILTGTNNPLNTSGKKDDVYLNTTTNEIFVKNENSWVSVGKLEGSKGEAGSTGLTPFIGENGNWWIGDVDTKVVANKDVLNEENVSEGFNFSLTYYDHKPGLIATSYIGKDLNPIMPDYVDSLPVVTVANDFFAYSNNMIESIKFSKNIIDIKPFTLLDKDHMRVSLNNFKKIDFNECKLETIPNNCFNNGFKTLEEINLSSFTKTIGERAFEGTNIRNTNLKNVETIGHRAFNLNMYPQGIFPNYYISKKVKTIGIDAFSNDSCLYIEALENEEGFNYEIKPYYHVTYNIKKNDSFIYSLINDDKEVIIHKYLKDDLNLIIPETIDSKPVVGSGDLSFARFNLPGIGNLRSSLVYDSIIFPKSFRMFGDRSFSFTGASLIYVPDNENLEFSTQGPQATFSQSSIVVFGKDYPRNVIGRKILKNVNFEDIAITKNKEILIKEKVEIEGKEPQVTYSYHGLLKSAKPVNEIPRAYNDIPITKLTKKSLLREDCFVLSIHSSLKFIDSEAIEYANYLFLDKDATETYFVPGSVSCFNFYTNATEYDPRLEGRISANIYKADPTLKAIHLINDLFCFEYIDGTAAIKEMNFLDPGPGFQNALFEIRFPRKVGEATSIKLLEQCIVVVPHLNYIIYIPREITEIHRNFMGFPLMNLRLVLEKEESEFDNLDFLTASGRPVDHEFGATLPY